MALRYSYGKNGWKLDSNGEFRTPQEIGRFFHFDISGYDTLNFSRYETQESLLNSGWTSGSLETEINYSIDPFGNFYQDPNGRVSTYHAGNLIRTLPAQNLQDFRESE